MRVMEVSALGDKESVNTLFGTRATSSSLKQDVAKHLVKNHHT